VIRQKLSAEDVRRGTHRFVCRQGHYVIEPAPPGSQLRMPLAEHTRGQSDG
jgi:hypothetical protein